MSISITAAVLSLVLTASAAVDIPDLDGDGRADAVRMGPEEFLVEVYLAGPDGLPGEPSARLEVPEARKAIWNGVTGLRVVPDLNADGLDDLVVVSSMRGVHIVHVWYGGPAGLSLDPDFSHPLMPALQGPLAPDGHSIEPLTSACDGRVGVRVSGRVFLTRASAPVPAHRAYSTYSAEQLLAADARVRLVLGGGAGPDHIGPQESAAVEAAVLAEAELHLIVLDALIHDPARARQLFAQQYPANLLRMTHPALDYGSIVAAKACVEVIDGLLAEDSTGPEAQRLAEGRAELALLANSWEAAYGAE